MVDENSAGSSPETKVGRLIAEYDLGEDYGDALERQWLGRDTERRSLRTLADRFNRQLLATAMDEAGMTTIEGEVDNVLRLLTDDETTAGARTEVERRLEREGIDVEALQRDFVTYQAIRSYLRDVRGVEYDGVSDEDRIERTATSVERLRSRLSTVGEKNLDQLRDADRITLGDFRLFVTVDVLCEECGSQFSFGELLQRGGCDCGTRRE